MPNKYDVIGDIHGMEITFRKALAELGYGEDEEGHWSHPEGRVLVSVGDLLDRGPAPLDCLELMARMVQDGCGLMVLGNHEINALHFDTRHSRSGKWLRDHTEKNRKQFLRTALQITKNLKRWAKLKTFLQSQPTHLELGDEDSPLRVIHACWSQGKHSAEDLPPFIDTPEILDRTADKADQDPMWQAVECCLKGPEEPCEPFEDKDGHKRKARRVRWWEDYPEDAPMLAFGHYWFPGDYEAAPNEPSFLGPAQNAVCLDYSLGNPDKVENPRVAVLRWPEKEILSFEHQD